MPIRKTDGSAKPERRIDAPESIIANSSVDNITAGPPADMVMMTRTLFSFTYSVRTHSFIEHAAMGVLYRGVCLFLSVDAKP